MNKPVQVDPKLGVGPWSRPRKATHVFFVLAVLTAGALFCNKIYEFLQTIQHHELVGFAHDPILIYLCVAAGFAFLLCWAFLSGQLRDLERAKYEMIERFDEQERAEGLRYGTEDL